MDRRALINISLAAGVLLVGLILLYFMPLSSFWTTDGGNKFIQVQNFDRYGGFAIHYPAADIDPAYKYFPYCGHHFKRIDDEIYSFYPFYFPLASFPFYKLLGIAGLYVIPLVSSILTLGVLFFILKRFGLKKYFLAVAALFVFATPAFFYSIVFWEMSLAVFFFSVAALLTINALLKKDGRSFQLFVAGLFLGLCSLFREEGYLLFAAVVLACFICMRGQRKASLWIVPGWVALILPLWIFQYFFYGHFLGLHAAEYNSLENGDLFSLAFGKLGNFYAYLFKGAALALFLPLFCACLKGRILKFLVLPVLVATCAIYCFEAFGLFSGADPVVATLHTQALFLQSPFLFLLLISFRSLLDSPNRVVKFSFLLCGAYLFLACLFLNRMDIGIIWGPRHFLFLYPLFLPLAFYSIRKNLKLFRFSMPLKALALCGVAFLFFISLCVQLVGVRTLCLKKKGSRILIESLKTTEPDIIVSDIFWLPEEAASIYFEKKFMSVNGQNSIEGAIRTLKDKGVDKFVLVLSKKYRRIRLDDMKKAMKSVKIISAGSVNPPGMAFMEIHILLCEIKK